MSASIFKRMRKPGYAPTLMAGMLSNIMVFAEPVSRATNNLMTETPVVRHYLGNGGYGTAGFPYPPTGDIPLPTVDSETKSATLEISNAASETSATTVHTARPSAHVPTVEYTVHHAQEGQGAIGKSSLFQADNVRDNYFTIFLPEDLDLGAHTPILAYDLYGLANAGSTTKSINGSAAYGGAELEKDEQWKEVEEYLPGALLKPGENKLFFNRRIDEVYSYNVKNLRIKLQKTSGGEVASGMAQSLATLEVDSNLDSKAFSPGEMAEGVDVFEFHSVKIEAGEQPGNVPSLTVTALPFKDVKPLDNELVNVTKGAYKGYKIQTAGQTGLEEGHLKLHLAYDPEKIPEGYTARDVKTYYYDKGEHRWRALWVEETNKDDNTLVSILSDPGGETDYINGVIKVPEQPETSSFVPTAMNDIEFANPAAGVVSIPPPSPNNMGSVGTSFPIKLPAGRNGLQPSLEVSYNSDGGNGWMGMGWDVGIPAIALNTKWGVPVFDKDYESELYSLSGGDLVLKDLNGAYTNPHRDADIGRATNREFYLRKEGGYLQITRHEDNGIPGPNNTKKYWWEVTDKFGNKSFYGGHAGSVVDNSVLKDDTGNIIHWALVRQEDTYGNYVEYTYDKQPVTVSGITGWEFHIKKIEYTLHNNANSNYYRVEFDRSTGRQDIITSARNRVFQITKDVLSEITVYFVEGSATETIRTYKFEYKEGPFLKQHLERISEYDSDNKLFYSNTMEYFEMDGNIIDDSYNNWEGGSDNVSSPLHDLATGGVAQIIPKGSALGTSVSSGGSFGLRLGGGIGKTPTNVANTLGGSYSYNSNSQDTRISFIDINGDGLPDKVYTNQTAVYYRPNTGDGFGGLIPISGLNSLDQTVSKTNGLSGDVNFLGLIGTGRSKSKTKTVTDHYFVDFNGDGLPDMMSNNQVKFNTTQPNGDNQWRLFIPDVDETENPIVSGNMDPGLFNHLELETKEELREQHSQFDHVKVWRAPYQGYINVTGQVTQLIKNDCDYSTENNDFKFTIEKAGATQISGLTNIEANIIWNPQYSNTIDSGIISVHKGDLLFFRVHNIGYGCGGEVEWNPTITYSPSFPYNFADEHGKQMHIYSAEQDYIMNNGGRWSPHNDETTVTIDFNLNDVDFNAYEFSDDIRFIIKKINIDLNDGSEQTQSTWTRIYDHEDGTFTGGGSNPFDSHNINPSGFQTVFEFFAESDSNVAWDDIDWKPQISGVYSGSEYPPVTYTTYDDNVNQNQYWVESNDLPQIGNIPNGEEDDPMVTVKHNLFSFPSSQNPPNFDSLTLEEKPIKINWVVKEEIAGTVKVVYKRTFYLMDDYGVVKFSQNSDNFVSTDPILDAAFTFSKQQIKNIRVNNGKIYAAFYVDNREIRILNNTNITLEEVVPPQQTPSVYAIISTPFISTTPAFFGLPYRGWGQFLYNGGLAYEYDNEGEITATPPVYFDGAMDMGALDFESDPITQDELNNLDPADLDFNGNTIRYAFYQQENGVKRYVNKTIIDAVYGPNGNGDLTATVGRFGEGNIYDLYLDVSSLQNDLTWLFAGLKQRAQSKGTASSDNFALFNGTESTSSTKVLNQYIDLNGDRYPDIVTQGKIQFTDMRGGLSSTTLDGAEFGGFISGSENRDSTCGVSIASIEPNSDNTGAGIRNPLVMNTHAGINGAKGMTSNSTQWMDMNGDGLPDQVTFTDHQVLVNLNTGYGFSEDVLVWGSNYSDLLASTRENGGVGAPLPGSSSISVGFGAGLGNANVNTTLVDVNGDGLPDLVRRKNVDYEEYPCLIGNYSYEYVYHLNTGTSFQSEENAFINNKIDENSSLSGNAYASYTNGFWFSILGVPIKLVGTGSIGLSAGFDEKKVAIGDINGDGLPDILYKEDDNSSVKARLNRVGKTHLLIKVNMPLGGSWEVDYAQVGNTYDMPQSKWVMSTLKTYDGFTGDNAFDEANSKTLTAFIFEDGNHDRRDRDFYGFEKVTTQQLDPANGALFRYTVKKYHNQDYYFKGALKESASFTAADEQLSNSRNFYNLRKPNVAITANMNTTEDSPFIETGIGDLDRTRAVPVLVKTINRAYEDGQFLDQVLAFMQYDAWGNITQYIDHGTGAGDAYRTEIVYGNSNYKGLPTDIQVYKNAGGTTPLRRREAAYNAQGKLDLITTHLGGSNTNQIQLEYDNYGNTLQVHQLDNMDAAGTGHFTQEIAYDPVLHTYPVEFSDSFGQSSTTVYDHHFGVPVFMTDMNGNSMRTRIDNRGRPIEIAGPYEYDPGSSDGTDWLIRKQYKGEGPVEGHLANSGPNDYRFVSANGSFEAVAPGDPTLPTDSQHHAVTRHKDPSSPGNEFLTVSIVDGFGQAIQLKKKHFKGDSDTVWQVGGFEWKDKYGRVINSYLPSIENIPPNADIDNYASLNVVDWTYLNIQPTSLPDPVIMEYDERDRQTKIQQPNEQDFTSITYGIESNMMVTKVVNEESQAQDTYTDIRGRQRKVVQNNEITTEFYYNAINELTKVKNHAGYETKYEYDQAGRRTREHHPDRGLTTYSYDNAGRLTEKQTSNLMQSSSAGIIEYKYDYHRLMEVNYPHSTENNVGYVYGGTGGTPAPNSIGRLVRIEDATGIQLFDYGKLGEMTRQRRSMAVAGKKSYWFSTTWEYDSWNRVKKIKYPDEEEVTYHYDVAGQLKSIKTNINQLVGAGTLDDIVTNITYTEYGERKQIEYGNGTVTNYEYDVRRRMNFVGHQFGSFQIDKEYTYDALSNIETITTPNFPTAAAGILGGPTEHIYTYDNYNRLIKAEGYYVGPDDLGADLLEQAYTLDMEYDTSHRILNKQQVHQYGSVTGTGGSLPLNAPHAPATSYSLVYEDYAEGAHVSGAGGPGHAQPHAPRKITEFPNEDYFGDLEDPRIKRKLIDYDANGNMLSIKEQISDPEDPVGYTEATIRENLWDEEDRLRAVDLLPEADTDSPEIAVYTYDASGERSIKYVPARFDAFYSAKGAGKNHRLEAMLYPSPLLTVKTMPMPEDTSDLEVMTLTKYTKHYYMGSERISSALGTSKSVGLLCVEFGADAALIAAMNDKVGDAGTSLVDAHQSFDKTLALLPPYSYEGAFNRCDRSHNGEMYGHYWYHPDHLGSSNYITNLLGDVTQHMEYLPFGETLAEEHLNSNNSPYKFNAKEFDAETGWYYYSARYYDPKWSIWLSVDPLAEEFPSWTPYHYVHNNPIIFIDPTGMSADWYADGDGGIVYDENIKNQGDLDRAGIEGEYIAESFVGIDQNQSVFQFNEDGIVNKSNQSEIGEGSTVVAIETFTGKMTERTTPSKGKQFAQQAGAAIIVSQADSPVPGPADVLALGLLYNAIKNLIIPQEIEGYHNLEFAKSKKGRPSARQEEVQHGNQGTGKLSGSKKTKHQKRRPGDGGEKKRQKPGWKQH